MLIETPDTPAGKKRYQLNPECVGLRLSKPDVADYKELKDKYLLVAALHSSEVQNEQREKIEKGIREGSVNCILSTPTLEMGIDIGKLRDILLIGVPPMPSNYIQRAGRAGRGNGDNSALIVTFCSDDNEHDLFYFQQPTKMIAGVVSPPHFDPALRSVIMRHIYALVHPVGDGTNYNPANVPARAKRAYEVFGGLFTENDEEFEKLFEEAYKDALAKLKEIKRGNKGPQQWFYSAGFYPDHGFRHDMVYVVDYKTADEEHSRRKPHQDIEYREYALSEREPEVAIQKFVPGATTYFADGIYTLTSRGEFDTFDSTSIRSYQILDARKHEQPPKDKLKIVYEFKRSFLSSSVSDEFDETDGGKVMRTGLINQGILSFRNMGKVQHGEPLLPFKDDETGELFCLGYDILRNAIVLSFPEEINHDKKNCMSFVSSLERAIVSRFRLSEGDLRLRTDMLPESDAENWIYVLLYDFDGNGNVPINKIYAELKETISYAYETMSNCPCENGCYACLKSYSSQFQTGPVSKKAALMVAGYLLGKNTFEPSLSSASVLSSSSLVFKMKLGDPHKMTSLNSGKEYISLDTGSYTANAFELISRAARLEFLPECAYLQIQCSADWFVNTLNGTGSIKSKEDKQAFARMQFDLLRFKSVEGKGIKEQ